MSKIQTFGTITRLRNNELLAFGREIEAAIIQADAATLKVFDSFEEYKAKLQQYDDGIVTVSKSMLTNLMVAAKKDRNNLHIGILEHIRTGTRHFIVDKRDAANRLLPLTSTYVGAQNRGFDDQTGFEYNFLQQLKSDLYKADVTLLGMDEWVAELEKVNNKCSQLSTSRTKEKAGKALKGVTVVNRQLFESAYNALVELLNAFMLVDGEEKYKDLFSWWNARIDHYRVVISNNLGAGKGGQTGGGNKPPVTPGDSGSGGEEERPGEL